MCMDKGIPDGAATHAKALRCQRACIYGQPKTAHCSGSITRHGGMRKCRSVKDMSLGRQVLTGLERAPNAR